MKRFLYPVLALATLAAVLPSCSSAETPSGESVPDLGWIFTGKGPYTLDTRVQAAPGPAYFQLVTDRSLMAETPEVVLTKNTTIGPDSTVHIPLGKLDPGFYQVRLRDSVRFNIGVRPDAVLSAPDAQPDFDAFWETTLSELAQVPVEPEYTLVPEASSALRTCYQVRYPSWGGAVSGGILSVPVAPGKYPVYIQYMGYGADIFHFDPNANPDRIDFLVSVRDQGIFKNGQDRWIDRGLSAKEDFYYRGAFADARRAVDFAASLEMADPERIVAYGESQGGALTVAAAALDNRIKAIAPAVPFLGDYPDYAKIVWWPVHEVFDTADAEGIAREDLFRMLSYFDIKNFAPRVSCPAYMAFGLQDPTCPPHTNFAIYNNLGSADKRWFCVPTCGHAMWMEPSWSAVRDEFLNGAVALPPRGSDQIKVGVAGFSYRKYDIETTLQYLQSMDVHYLSIKDFWLPLDATTEQMDAFKATCARYGVKGYILGPIYMSDEAAADRAFDYVARYGVDMFIGVPDYDILDYVIQKVAQTGIRVAIHTHGPDGAAFPDIRTIVEKVKDPSLGVGCCMDLGHSFRMGWDVAEDILTYKDWIYDVHIKDETAPDKTGQTWEMGRGRMDLVGIVKAFREIGYQGVLSVEFEKNGDNPHPGVAESIGYLRGVLDATKQ